MAGLPGALLHHPDHAEVAIPQAKKLAHRLFHVETALLHLRPDHTHRRVLLQVGGVQEAPLRHLHSCRGREVRGDAEHLGRHHLPMEPGVGEDAAHRARPAAPVRRVA